MVMTRTSTDRSRSNGSSTRRKDREDATGGRSVRRGAERQSSSSDELDTGPIHPFIWITFLAILLPEQFSLKTGSITLTPFKVIMILIFIPALMRFMKECKPNWLDGMFFAYVFYTVLCVMINRGAKGIEIGGDFLMETLVVYLVVRSCLTSLGRIKSAIRMLIGIMAVLGVLAIPEAVFHNRFLQDIPAAITGVVKGQNREIRLGMIRASSTFKHTILFGVACSALVVYTWVLRRSLGNGVKYMAGILAGVFFSLSSAALLMGVLALGFLTAERYTRKVKKRGLIVLVAVLAVFIILSMVSNRGPVKLFISFMTLNTGTGYYRLMIWNNVVDDILRNPIFGMRPELWTRPGWMTGSIDNHWVMVALTGGLPALSFLTVFVFSTGNRILKMKMPGVPEPDDTADATGRTAQRSKPGSDIDPNMPRFKLDLRNGWVLSMIIIGFGGATVFFFGQMAPLFTFHLALGTALLALDQNADTMQRADRARNGVRPGPDKTTPSRSRGRQSARDAR